MQKNQVFQKKLNALSLIVSAVAFLIAIASFLTVIYKFKKLSNDNFLKTVCAQECDYKVDGKNDEVEIQKAIDDLEKNGGGKILIKKGDYFLSEHIFIRSDNITVQGEGFGTRLINSNIEEELTGKRDIFTITEANNIVISDLYLETAGWLVGQGIQIKDNSSNVYISNINVKFGVDGISLQGVSNVYIDNVSVEGAEHGIAITNSEYVYASDIRVMGRDEKFMQRGLAIWNSRFVDVSNFTAQKIGVTGVFIRGQNYGKGFNAEHITINNVTVLDPYERLNWGVKIQSDGIDSKDMSQIQISNAYLESFGEIGDGITVVLKDGNNGSLMQFQNIVSIARRNPLNFYAHNSSLFQNVQVGNLQLIKTDSDQKGKSQFENVSSLNIFNVQSSSQGGIYTGLSVRLSESVTLNNLILDGFNEADYESIGNVNEKFDSDNIVLVNQSYRVED
jgi:polygalacturonase